jgi:crotonobetainyl-CoA:carnitine CoA-transferase CaiB-like acyl-CoA transferase
MPGPLDGIRVLDITTVVAGPYSTMLLGELGAEIIKIEPPEGDTMRFTGWRRHNDMASIFLTLGRNKRSVVLDLKKPEATAAIEKLVSTVDVVIHNLRRPAAAKLGLDYDSLRAINPALVYVVGLGFGDGGPYSGRPAYDDVVQAMAGPVGLMERASGESRFVPQIFVDKTTGMALSAAVTAALFHRERTGEGQEVSVPMFELMAGFSMVEHLFEQSFVQQDDEDAKLRMGYTRVLSPHRRPYRTSDGQYVCALPYTDRHYRRLFVAIDRPDLAADPLFGSIVSRAERIDDVYATVSDIVATRAADEWMDIFAEAHIPSARVTSLEDLLDDPHLEAVDFWDAHDHPSEGPLRLPRSAISFGATPTATRRPAPRLGQHTIECLSEAGMTDNEVQALLRAGAGQQAPPPTDS